MKKFGIVKVTFEAYIAVNAQVPFETIKDHLEEKLIDRLEMYCTDNAFGLADCKVNLEIQE